MVRIPYISPNFGNMVDEIMALVEGLIREYYASQPHTLQFHNLDHALQVRRSALEISIGEGLENPKKNLVEIAALFHDSGYFEGAAGHELRSVEIAKDLLGQLLDEREMKEVEKLILATDHSKRPESLLEMVLCDADLSYLGTDQYPVRAQLLRKEMAEFRDRQFTDGEWIAFNLSFFKSHQYYTKAAQKAYGSTKRVHQAKLEQALNK